MAKRDCVLGMDIGGTNIRAGIVDRDYMLSKYAIHKTAEVLSGKDTMRDLLLFIQGYRRNCAADANIMAIAIGFPSILDPERRTVLSSPNISGFDNIPVVEMLGKYTKIPVYINKDVNMLMLHDMHQHGIPPKGIAAGFYFGTGIGNAISIDGTLIAGKNGAAAELGHIPGRNVDGVCGCGNTSCAEIYASGRYLQRVCALNFPDAELGDIFTTHGQEPLIQNFVKDLSLPAAAEINILDPHYIIIGGGIPQMKDFPRESFENWIRHYTRKPYPEKNLDFIYAVQAQENGVIGAGIYGLKEMENIVR